MASAGLCWLDDHDLVGRGKIERSPHLRVEQVRVEVLGPHIAGPAFEPGALARDVGQRHLGGAQFLRQAHPGPKAAITLDEVVGEIAGERQAQHGRDENLGAAAHFAEYDHRPTESLAAVCVNASNAYRTLNKNGNRVITQLKMRIFIGDVSQFLLRSLNGVVYSADKIIKNA